MPETDYSEPEPAPAPEPVPEAKPPPKKKRESTPMTAAQKKALTKHMEKMKKGGMDSKEAKSHRMKMMVRMRRGMSVGDAHKDAMK